ncbi:uncharacterized protein LOC135141090 [Zophobas morio]|uniref:uncharacterized protein LOC135141090 n=1 Tax=Zophobas morio TaxID=2755281 RepID=UPI0030829695
MSLSVPHSLYNVLKAKLNSRIFSVRVGDTRSPLRSLTARAPQGSLLSALIITIYMSDVPLLSDSHTRIALYADDTTVYTYSKSSFFLCKVKILWYSQEKCLEFLVDNKISWLPHVDYMVAKI